MRAQIRKWGNSLGLRLPKSIAMQAGIEDETVVEIEIFNNTIKITKIVEDLTLDRMLDEITVENLHSEIETNNSTGEESW